MKLDLTLNPSSSLSSLPSLPQCGLLLWSPLAQFEFWFCHCSSYLRLHHKSLEPFVVTFILPMNLQFGQGSVGITLIFSTECCQGWFKVYGWNHLQASLLTSGT
jgi:hypothetical protein